MANHKSNAQQQNSTDLKRLETGPVSSEMFLKFQTKDGARQPSGTLVLLN